MKNDFTIQKGKKLTIKQRNNIQLCEIDKITHIKCDRYISTINLINSENIKVSRLLKEFELELFEYKFVRVNRSTLVNVAHITKFKGGCCREIEMINGEIITVSRRNVFKLKESLSFSLTDRLFV